MGRILSQKLVKYKYFHEWKGAFVSSIGIIDIFVFLFIHKKSIEKMEQKKNKPIWLFCERGSDARDNAFVLFKYVRENHPEIAAYYVISEDCKDTIDYKRVEKIGNIIHHKSFEHKLYFLLADVLIDTHLLGWISPWRIGAYVKLHSMKHFGKPFVFLQHGIVKDDLSDKLGKQKNDFSIFICGAKPEYDYILKNFGFDESVVKYTGLARYDNLHNIRMKNQILIMPTWRQYIMQPSFEKNEIVSDEEFLKTEYYKTYQELINNEQLYELLRENDMELIFYLHFEAQRYIEYFTTTSKNIIIADKEHYDVQTLLKESKLLITDYSSVFFDFAYMKKPMLLYQFDEDEFFTEHYKKGYFDYRRDGFGKVVIAEDKLVDELKKIKQNNFEMEEKYAKRIKRFFPLHDQKNCERTFDIIRELKKAD